MLPQFSCVPLRSTSENCAVLPCFSDFGCFPTAHFLTFPLLLENLFTREIRKSLKSKITDMSWYDFRYTWFLTCLFHDAASSIEGLQVDNCSCGLDETLKKLDVTITPFIYTPIQPHAELTCYNWDTIDAYYKFEMDRCGDAFCAEHGIIGGCMLFDRLYRVFPASMWMITAAGRSNSISGHQASSFPSSV